MQTKPLEAGSYLSSHKRGQTERITPIHRAIHTAIHRAIHRSIHRAVHRAVHRAIAVTKPRTRAPLTEQSKSLQLRDPGKDRQLMCAKPIDREAPHTLGASAAINPKKVE